MKLKDKKIQLVEQDGTKYYPIHPGKVWAYYRQLSGQESHTAGLAGFKEDLLFVVNWRGDIYMGMFIKYNNKVYEITRVDNYEGYKNDLALYCTKMSKGITVQEYPG